MALQITLGVTETMNQNIYPTAYMRIASVGLKGENVLINLETFANVATGTYARESRDVVIKEADGLEAGMPMPQSIARTKPPLAPLYDILAMTKVIDSVTFKAACYLWLKKNGYEEAIDILEE